MTFNSGRIPNSEFKFMSDLILINAYSPAVPRQALRLREELTLLGAKVEIERNNKIRALVNGGDAEYSDPPRFCVYLDKDKYIAHILEKTGVRLFNRAQAIEDCDDKMTTHIRLAGLGIPMPKTIPGLLCYDDSPLDDNAVDEAAQKLGYPVIVKLSYGSMGKSVFKADDRAELIQIANKVKPYPHLFQQYAEKSHGKDLRVIVIGGKVLGGILRTSNGDFRSNVGLGGKAVQADVPEQIQKLALAAAAELGLDYCGMDFLLGDTPLLCEVNSNAFFDAFEQATGINVAKAYAEHILNGIK